MFPSPLLTDVVERGSALCRTLTTTAPILIVTVAPDIILLINIELIHYLIAIIFVYVYC